MTKRKQSSPADIDGISEKEIIKLVHDLQVDQVALELQNKELITTQLELEKARDHYQHLYDFSPVACFTVDKGNLIREVNLAGSYLVDIARNELINHRFTRFLIDDDLNTFNFYKKQIINNKQKQYCHLRMIANEGNIFYAHLEGTVSDIEDRINLSVIDITRHKDRESKLYSCLDNSGIIGVFYYNLDGQITDANNKFLEITGYSREDLQAGRMNWINMTPPEHLKANEHVITEFISHGMLGAAYEKEYIRKDGSRVPIIVGETKYDEASLEGIAFIRDISESKLAEKRLLEEKSRAQQYLDIAGVIIIAVDTSGTVMLVNKKGCEILGYDESDIIGKNWFDNFVPEKSRQKEADAFSEMVLAKHECGTGHYERAVLTNNGAELTISWHNTIIRDEARNVIGYLGSGEDVTERKRITNELAWQTTVLNMIMENTGTQLVYLDRDFNVVMANKAYIDSTGYTWEELAGKNIFSFFPSEVHEAIFRKARDTGETISRNDMPIEFPNQLLRGISYWDSTLVPIKDKDGSVTGLVLSLIETTERKKMEQMKDEFIALVSHELRTPITVISGSLQVTKGEGLSIEEKQELIQNAIDVTGNLSDILENMLELSRHQTGRLKLNTERIYIGSVINEVVDKMKNAGVRQRFQLEIPEVLPLIDADPLRVERILHNLIENAVKYSPADSEIKITVQSGTDFLVTSVIDQGKGIPEGIKHKLFQMFERGDDQGMIGGTGLGLVVCKRLVEEHGGWIEVESESGRGATFSFGIPL